MIKLISLKNYLIFTCILTLPFISFANVISNKCSKIFKKYDKTIPSHIRTFEPWPIYTINDLLQELRRKNKLIYETNLRKFKNDITKYKSKYEINDNEIYFSGSTENDWIKTPFDHIKADTLIGFGTNSALEIAADKNVSKLILADVYLEPLLGFAFEIEPIWRISKSPNELILYLSGILPTETLLQKSIQETIEFVKKNKPSLIQDVNKRADYLELFMSNLAQNKEISDLEFKVLSTKYLIDYNFSPPDNYYSCPSFIVGRLFDRYDLVYLKNNYPNILIDEKSNLKFMQQSVLHNLSKFNILKTMFANGLKYAKTEVDDFNFYKQVSLQGDSKNIYSISVSNIFDVPYNLNLDFTTFQSFLKKTRQLLMKEVKKPMTVFRTTGYSMDHGFYRYSILDNAAGVPVQDEIDSTANAKK